MAKPEKLIENGFALMAENQTEIRPLKLRWEF